MENQYSYFDDTEFVKRQNELKKMKDELDSIEKKRNEVKTDLENRGVKKKKTTFLK